MKPTPAQVSAAIEAQRPPRADAVERAVSHQAQAARDLLASLGDDDEDLRADMVDGETGFNEAVAAAIAEMDNALALSDGVGLLIERYAARRDRMKRRAERIRACIEQAMVMANLTTMRLPAATLTIKSVPPKPLIEDESAIPAEFWKQGAPKLDRAAVNAAAKDRAIPGVTMTNGGASLQIRRL